MKEKTEDRISRYLSAGNRDMIFGELSEDFLRAIGGLEILKGIPVPIGGAENGNITVRSIVLDMARVIGGDASFVYAGRYLDYIKAAAGDQAEPMLVSEGAGAADEGNYEDACRLLRTALMTDQRSRAALYLYARACKACYEEASRREAEGETLSYGPDGRYSAEEYIGSFKAESLDSFEVLTMMHPEFAMGYYFLGYGYLNLGLYVKARLTWEEFMKLSSSADESAGIDSDRLDDLRHEISGMLLDLEDPVQIELGCNKIMGGDFAGGRNVLIRFREGKYEKWWPLWYYLGVAESALGNIDEAIEDLKKVLTLSPSNIDVMEELVRLLDAGGDAAGASKYRKKIEIVRQNAELDKVTV